jgi:putative ABC transport system permease protein
VRGGAVVRAALGGALRRLAQSLVVAGVLLFSTVAATLALAELTSADQGFGASLAAQHEAQLAVTINQARVTAAQLAATRHLSGVMQTSGPYPEATITATAPGAAASSPKFTVVGRASPGGTLDRIAWNTSLLDGITKGHSKWPSKMGEISIAQATQIRPPMDTTITITSAPGHPKLKVVGYASQTAPYDGGWVAPGEIPLLRAKGSPAREEMFYDFTSAGTTAQINADVAQLKRALGTGAIAGSQSYLPFAQETASEASVNTPFITTFAIIALVLALLIVASVVAAAVIASYRRIGVLKSVGFSPAQVTAVYLAQIGLPALAGAAAGAVLGNHWALPLIKMSPIPARVSVPVWIDVTAPAAMLALTAAAAAGPALHAGRLSAVQAIVAGQAPRAGRGYLPHRLAARLPLPRPVTAGLTAPFSRPARSAITLVSIVAGLAAVVLATGLTGSIHKINHSALQGLGQVQVTPRGVRYAPFPHKELAAVAAALSGQPGTLHYVAESDIAAGAPVAIRITGTTTSSLDVTAYNGAPSWLGQPLVAGHWYRGAGEVDASSQLLADIRKRVGQQITMTVDGRPQTVRIAGEVFIPSGAPTLFASWQALGRPAAARLATSVSSYDINLKKGTSTSSYIAGLVSKLGKTSYIIRTPAAGSPAAYIKSSYFRLLAILVAVLAALGVLNSVLMATRERLHDLGVFKALGMTPAQMIEMVLCWVIVPTIMAAVIALPAGLIAQDELIRHLARSSADLILPGSFVHVLGPGELALLTLAGLVIAVVGALGPATWAAASRATTALHAE